MEDNSESIEFIDDVTEEKLKLKENIYINIIDKIDASNLQSKSFQAIFTSGSKLSSRTF